MSAGTIGMESNAFGFDGGFEGHLAEAFSFVNPPSVGLHPSRPSTAMDGYATRGAFVEPPDFLPSRRPKFKKSKWGAARTAVRTGSIKDKVRAAAQARRGKNSFQQKWKEAMSGMSSGNDSANPWAAAASVIRTNLPPPRTSSQRAADHLDKVATQGQRPSLESQLGAPPRPSTVHGSGTSGAKKGVALTLAPPSFPDLIESAPHWMKVTPDITRAADIFDRQQTSRYARAANLSKVMNASPMTSPRGEQALFMSIFDVQVNRYVPPMKPLEQIRAVKAKPRKPPPVVEKRNVWAARAAWADSGDCFDTDEVEEARALHDWPYVYQIVQPLLNKYKRAGQDIVDDVKEVLLSVQDIVVKVFEFYASLGGNLHTISMNGWSQFTNDFKLVNQRSKFMKRSDLDLLFVSVDSATDKMIAQMQAGQAELKMKMTPKQQAAAKKHSDGLLDEKKALSRVEFFAALILLSVNKYLLTGEADAPADAFFLLATGDLEAHFDPKAFAPSNAFRVDAYEKSTNDALLVHDASLRNIFHALCEIEPQAKRSQMINMDMWCLFLKLLGMVGQDVTVRDAKLCFSWSRMMVIQGSTEQGRKKESGLPYEGFLEALCRLSVLKALPFDDELEQFGVPDAGVLHLALNHSAGDIREALMAKHAGLKSLLEDHDGLRAYKKSLAKRCVAWGDDPLQPLARCVTHLVTMIVRLMDSSSKGAAADDLKLTDNEALQWAKGKYASQVKLA